MTVTCAGPFGETEPLTYAVSFEEFRHQTVGPTGSLHCIEQAVDKLIAAVTRSIQRR